MFRENCWHTGTDVNFVRFQHYYKIKRDHNTVNHVDSSDDTHNFNHQLYNIHYSHESGLW